MIIKEIRIRNFRSIIRADIPLNNVSIFVGLNDVGKSNILKALNLFFNDETDYEKPLDFNEDYSKHAPARKNKAEEIIVELILNAPKNYKGSKDIMWTKVWRSKGLFENKCKTSFVDGSRFPKKSKLISWRNNIRYTYIPAIRGASYFQILLAKLHDTLAETIENELRLAGDDFIAKVKSNTEGMRNEILERMGMQSQITFPPNLRSLFKTLDFATSESNFSISLSNRGDGIKTRHIPAILKFISDQLNFNRIKGSPNVSTIWGYEEPENNLEMIAAFNLAEQFHQYSDEIQILLTTHSSGFYSLKGKYPKVTFLYKVSKTSQGLGQINPIEKPTILDHEMGIMPIITPYIEEKITEIVELRKSIDVHRKELEKINNNILFVEGEDETRIFSIILSEQKLESKIVIRSDGKGCSGVRSHLMAWSWRPGNSSFKAIGILDSDAAGRAEVHKLRTEKQFNDSSGKQRVKVLTYKAPKHLLNIKQKIHEFPIELEEMYTVDIWKIAKEKNWLVERDNDELHSLIKPDSIHQTILDKIKSFGFSEDESLYVHFKFPDQHKEKVSKYISRKYDRTKSVEGLDSLIEYFNQEVPAFINS